MNFISSTFFFKMKSQKNTLIFSLLVLRFKKYQIVLGIVEGSKVHIHLLCLTCLKDIINTQKDYFLSTKHKKLIATDSNDINIAFD